MAACAVAFASIACESGVPMGPGIVIITEIPTLEVAPASSSVQVGQTIQLTHVVRHSTNQAVTWSSSNDAIASVGPTGVVRCHAVGAATITGTSADGRARATAVVNCTAPPQTTLIAVSTTTLTFSHIVGTTSCPQGVGTVRVTNVSPNAISVSVATPSMLTLNSGSSSFALAPGGVRDVAVSFNCATQNSFAENVTFTSTNAASTDIKTTTVTGTITR